MLSRPPASLAAAISPSPASRRRARGEQHGRDLLLGDHRRETVAAEQVDIARARAEGTRVDLDGALGPERARDHRALRMLDRLLGRKAALAHQLVDERVIVGEAQELAVTQAVRAAVADVRDRDLSSPTYTAVSVVPMPACSAFACESSWMRALAASASAASACSGSDASSRPPGRTRPRCARRPRRPARRPCRRRRRTAASARAASPRWPGAGGPCRFPCTARQRAASSVDLELEFAVADANAIAGVQRPRRLQQLLVEIRAVGRTEVFDHDDVALLVDTARAARRRTGPRAGSRRGHRVRARCSPSRS